MFSSRRDMIRFAQAILRGELLSREELLSIATNYTGRNNGDGTWRQYLGFQCFTKHPYQHLSEVPEWMQERSIGLSGFTGHHLSVDVQTGTFAVFLGSRVMNRLTVLIPEAGRSITDYGLNPDGTGQVLWPDGRLVWSSVDYVHQKDAHLHRAVADTLGLPDWQLPGRARP